MTRLPVALYSSRNKNPFLDIFPGAPVRATRAIKKAGYWYLIFIQSKNRMRPKVMIFAAMMGNELIQIPYSVHRSIPTAKSRSIASEKSLVSLSFQVRMTCGTNEMVVRVPAR
jgi:hypothetical protein